MKDGQVGGESRDAPAGAARDYPPVSAGLLIEEVDPSARSVYADSADL